MKFPMTCRTLGGRMRAIATAMLAAGLAACTVGPDYQRPTAPTPVAYKEVAGWKLAEPQQAGSNQAWWSIYNDAELDALERQIDISNQNLKAAEAAYRQATALVNQARAGFFPTATFDTGLQYGQQGGNPKTTLYQFSGGASWEPDIWGKIRRTVESSEANAQASAADLAAARLSAQSELATDYFQLRVEDGLKRLLDATVIAFARSEQITQNRYDAGTAAKSDVASAEAQLESTRAQAINVGVLRSQLEHAIAVLIGKPPGDFAIAPAAGVVAAIPVVPPGLPSTLLERRPDIASAERLVAAANAQIGVAISAYFPDITLTASIGYAATALAMLVSPATEVWAVGPQLAETLFDAGLRNAQVAQARATYDQQVAVYRQTVLTAFQQVEDQLAALRILEQEASVQDAAVKAAEEAEQLILNEYEAGIVDYTAVITAQTNALGNEQAALAILQNRITASVALIAALGGGWDASQLPSGNGELKPATASAQ